MTATKKAAKFKKGQVVFQAVYHFKANDSTVERRVVSRTVDACGSKQMTFVCNEHWGFYGKASYFPMGNIFATPGEAFSSVAEVPDPKGKTLHIYPEVVSDAEWIPPTI